MKDKLKKFVRQHWIFIWALLSVVYAAIVQLLFSLKTSNQFCGTLGSRRYIDICINYFPWFACNVAK